MSSANRSTKLIEDSMSLLKEARRIENMLLYLGKQYLLELSVRKPNDEIIHKLAKDTTKVMQCVKHFQENALNGFGLKSKQADRNVNRILVCQKQAIISQNLRKTKLQATFIIRKQIHALLEASRNQIEYNSYAYLLTSVYNNCNKLTSNSTQEIGNDVYVCSNSYATLLLPQRNINIKNIIQVVSESRCETLCTTLISRLLIAYENDTSTSSTDSDTSSIEVLKTLTSQMMSATTAEITGIKKSPDKESQEPMTGQCVENLQSYKTSNTNMDILADLLSNEEEFYSNITSQCLHICPSVFDGLSLKNKLNKWIKRAVHHLWTQVGGILEHVVLWWCKTPLASHPVICARHLRSWLLYIYPDDAPEIIVSILNSLGESLTIYVSNTSWDKQFRLALVASSLPIEYPFESAEFTNPKGDITGTTTTGQMWSDLFYHLALYCNNCDEQGTIPSELPIIEQITILHRLDHSIHTARLWAGAKSKVLCSEWNMRMFFKVVENDVNQCLQQINILQLPVLVSTLQSEEQIKVSIALRAKLISEIRFNIQKLKHTYNECIEVLAALCKILSLSTLNLCFPPSKYWQTKELQETASGYTTQFLDEIFLPVIKSTQVLDVLNLILRLICESWLQKIYMAKIKFSRVGALNLLKDFEGVSDWINNCKHLSQEYIDILLKHEVLKACEGVGKILLREPYEIISMKNASVRHVEGIDNEESGLPPEMFVSNQKQWLELKTGKHRRNCFN